MTFDLSGVVFDFCIGTEFCLGLPGCLSGRPPGNLGPSEGNRRGYLHISQEL